MSIKSKNGKHHINYYNIRFLLIIAFLVLLPIAVFCDKPGKDSWVIVIDPGHGGRDPGSVGKMSYEKNITLAVALKTGAYLESNLKNVKVIFTRKTDVFMDLDERSEIANKNKADLFISIHANAIDGVNAYGTETYIMGHSKDKQNLEVAMKENEVIKLEKDYKTKYEGFDPNSPESYVMFALMQNSFSEQSLDLAARMQSEYKEKVGRFDRGVKQAAFWVLWKTTMPSVLTEIGFITNGPEEKFLNSTQGQDYIASAIFRACRNYIADIERKSRTTVDTSDEKLQVNEAMQNEKEIIKQPVEKKDTVIQAEAPKTYFMVQVASGKKMTVKPSFFKNLKDITEIKDGDRYRYASGKFEDYSQAVQHRKKIETIYPDAFVIAIRENKILPLQDVLNKR
ncbi:MAG: N-acetylmuramoyl-L-alanine amidase [Bacteroidales bacterium]